ncbi:MAG: hypothetical protein AAGA54_03930 [Myxococcota bacterium]
MQRFAWMLAVGLVGCGDSGAAPEAVDPTCLTWCDGFPVIEGCDEASTAQNSSGADDTGLGLGDDMPLATDVFAIQQGSVDSNIRVLIVGSVVTSPVASDPTGRGAMFTVADPAGGPFSGITVRLNESPASVDLAPGDEVDIEGNHVKRHLFSELHARVDNVVLMGEAGLPDPVDVTEAQLASFVDGGDDAKPYDSVLIRVIAPEVIDDGTCVGELALRSTPIRVDDRFFAAQGEALPPGGLFSEVRGPLLYTLNGFEIAPRTLGDLGM